MRKREMIVVGRKVGFAEAEEEEILFWAAKTWKERLQEAERLRQMIWTQLLGAYPAKMKKVGGFVRWSTIED